MSTNSQPEIQRVKLILKAKHLRDIGGSLLFRVMALGLSFVGSVLCARFLGPSDFGIYSYALAWIAVLGIPAQLGVPYLLLRETAMLHANNDWSRMKGMWSWSTRTILMQAIATAICVPVLAIFLFEGKLSTLFPALAIGVLLIPLAALGNARAAALRGLHFNMLGQLPEYVVKPGVFALLLVVCWWTGTQISATTTMLLQVLAATVAFGVGAFFLIRLRPKQLVGVAADMSLRRSWRAALIPLAATSALGTLSAQLGVLVLGFLDSEHAVGIYKVAISVSTLSLVGVQAIALVTSPRIARAFALNRPSEVERVASATSLASVLLIAPFVAVFLFYGGDLIGLVYGYEYQDAFAPLIVLLSGNLIMGFFAASNVVMIMSRNEKQSAGWLSVSVVTNGLLCLLIVPSLGISGAAWAGASASVIGSAGLWLLAKRRTGIDSSVFAIVRHRNEAAHDIQRT